MAKSSCYTSIFNCSEIPSGMRVQHGRCVGMVNRGTTSLFRVMQFWQARASFGSTTTYESYCPNLEHNYLAWPRNKQNIRNKPFPSLNPKDQGLNHGDSRLQVHLAAGDTPARCKLKLAKLGHRPVEKIAGTVQCCTHLSVENWRHRLCRHSTSPLSS